MNVRPSTLGPSLTPQPLSALLLLLALYAPCPPTADAVPQQAAQQGAIEGVVAEAETGQPVPLAKVEVLGTDFGAVSSRTGRFTIPQLPAGSYDLSCKALGYEPAVLRGVAVSPGSVTQVSVSLRLRPISLDRLVVTAAKEAVTIAQTPALVSVVNRVELEATGNLELVDAVDHVAGIVHSAQAGSFESIELRGMPRQGNEFETTLLLIDGVPQTDSRNSARVINLPIDDASAIEIVRGPNSALYGRTAIGGAINVRTADPTPAPQATVRLEAGSFDHRRATVAGSGPVRDWGGYYLSWSAAGNSGFYTRDPDYEGDETAVFGKLTFTPDDRSEFMVSLNSVVSDNSLPTHVPIIDGKLLSEIRPDYDLYSNINLPTANYHQDELRFTASLTRRWGDRVSATGIFGYRDIRYKFEESGDIIGAPFDLVKNSLTMYPFALTTDEDIFYQEARLSISPKLGDIASSLMVGVSYEPTTGFRAGDLIYTDSETFGIPLNFMSPEFPSRSEWQFFRFGGQDYSFRNLGVYAQYTILPVSWLRITAAGRYDRLDLENVQTFKEGQPKTEVDYDAFSPKLSASFTLLDEKPTTALGTVSLSVYGTYSEAFKPPRTPSGLTPPDAEAKLLPEDIVNYEGGIKASFWDGRARLDATYFRMDRDGIVVRTREGPFFRDTNTGEQDFRGVELNLSVAPTLDAELYANAAFYKNRFGDFVIQTPSRDVVLTGNRLPLVPDRILSAGGRYEFANGLGFTANVKHVGDRYIDQGNTFLADPYTVVHGSVFWTRGPFRATVAAHNLLDHEYLIYGDIFNGESATPAAPRQVLVILGFTLK